MVEKYNEIMAKLDDSDKQYLSHFLKITNDKFSRNMLAKMAGQQSSMSYENIPLTEFGGSTKIHALSALRSMEKIGLTSSSMVKSELGTCRSYDVTDEGRAFVDEYMPRELEKISTL